MNPASDFDDSRTLLLKADVLVKAVTALKSMKGASLLSGDDSGLSNVWDEVCVQVQGEESFHWDTYLDVIDDLLTRLVQELSSQERLALWLRTEEGYDWLDEVKLGNADGNEPAVSIDQVSDCLKSDLMARAADFENAAIRRYLANQYGDDGWEDEEDEEEEEEVIEGDLAESLSQPTALASEEIEALWEAAMTEVRAEQLAAPGTDRILDEVYASLDERGKASLAAALEGLKTIFGSRLKSPDTWESEAAVRRVGEQLNLDGFDAKSNANPPDKKGP